LSRDAASAVAGPNIAAGRGVAGREVVAAAAVAAAGDDGWP